MKRIKKIASLLLAMVMVFAMSVTAFATEPGNANTQPAGTGNYSIQINDTTDGYEYVIYQIFSADIDTSDGKTLSNIEWGSAIDPAKAQEEFGKSARKVVEEDLTAENAAAYAKKFVACLKSDIDPTPQKVTTANGQGATFTGLTAGYYLIQNTSVPTDGSATNYIMNVVTENTLNPKRDVVTKDKDIIEEEGAVKVNDAPIGKEMTFRVWAKLPSNYETYDAYYLEFKDYLTKGFDYKGVTSVEVAKNSANDESPVFTTIENVTSKFWSGIIAEETSHNGKDVTTIKVAINDLKEITTAGTAEDKGNYIVLTYKAALNANAVVGIKGNPNYVKVIYSNDPNNSGKGDHTPGDEPKPSKPTGETPESETNTFTTELEITKVIGDTTTILPGAEFTLYGKNGVEISLVAKDEFVEDENGIYWKLKPVGDAKEGKYTADAPVSNNENPELDTTSLYESTTTKYKKVSTLATEKTDKGESKIAGVVDEKTGVVKFTGLGEGEYRLEETVTPSGYNTMDPQEFKITFVDATKGFKVTVTTPGVDPTKAAISPIHDMISFDFGTNIGNYKGSQLPSTGGIGTTIFYVVGGILVIGAGILLVTKRRMKAQ